MPPSITGDIKNMELTVQRFPYAAAAAEHLS